MPNIATILKQEIARISRKEARSKIEATQRASVACRKQIAAMKRRLDSLEREVARLRKQTRETAPIEKEMRQALRFRADGFRAHRERLGLSAREVGQLIGASPLSVYKWESGKARPRANHLEAIAALRKMGKREAATRLAELGT